VSNFEISKFFGGKDLLKKDVQQKQFLQNLTILVVKTIPLFNLLKILG
jgi:hypothetical protein